MFVWLQSDPKKVIYHNAVRTAEVALGRLKKFFYAQSSQPSVLINRTSLEARHLLKKQCHDIDWFLTHVIPEMPVPPDDAIYYESVTHESSGRCLQRSDRLLAIAQCELLKPQQIFYVDGQGRLRQSPDYCFWPQQHQGAVSAGWCNGKQKIWTYDESTHQLTVGSRCLTAVDDNVVMMDCNAVGRNSHWKFRYHFDWSKPLQHVQ